MRKNNLLLIVPCIALVIFLIIGILSHPNVSTQDGTKATSSEVLSSENADSNTGGKQNEQSKMTEVNLSEVEAGQYMITCGGTYHVYGTMEDGGVVVDASKDDKIVLVLDGVSITNSNHAAIYVKKADKVTLVLASDTQNELQSTGEFASKDENNVDAVVFSKDDLEIEGKGALNVLASHGHGITGKDDLTIWGGEITVQATGHAIEANDSITVHAGKLCLDAGKDGIHTENDENESLGIFTMNGGDVSIHSQDDGIHAVASLNINEGKLRIENCVEGLEAAKIYLAGGEIYINASDDGVNATVGAEIDCFAGEAIISISGGQVEIITGGDALDSNGDIVIEGGETIIHGPGNTVFGFEALDYASKAEIHGGRFIAFTSAGKSFADTSRQASFTLNLSNMTKNVNFILRDNAGSLLLDKSAKCPINSIVVSLPELKVGDNYEASIGELVTQVRQKSIVVKTKVTSKVTQPDEDDTKEDTEIENVASMTQCTYDGLNYWLYTPANAVENMPLIVYLHGGSGKGDDLALITGVDGFPQYVQSGKIMVDAYIIFPQCPAEQSGWKKLSTKIEELIEHTCKEYSLNTKMISLTGHSMGGTGVWTLALGNPELFYKIAPMSGSVKVTDSNVQKLIELPVWAVVGENDKIVSPESSIKMIEALKNSGADAKITVLEGATHFDVPSLGYLDENLSVVEWLTK